MSKIRLMVCCHKNTPRFRSDVLRPVHVGRAAASEALRARLGDMPGDDTGDNISSKNGSYCELTALYWSWKNPEFPDMPDYVGLCHYRRIPGLTPRTGRRIAPLLRLENRLESGGKTSLTSRLAEREIRNNLEDACARCDIVLPGPLVPDAISVYHYYALWFVESDLIETIDVIRKKYPEMCGALDETLRADRAYYCNVALMRRDLWEEYAAWLFDVLFEVERRIGDDVATRNGYQRRVYGFLAERLLNVWVRYRIGQSPSLRVGELPCHFFEGL